MSRFLQLVLDMFDGATTNRPGARLGPRRNDCEQDRNGDEAGGQARYRPQRNVVRAR